MAAPKFEIEFTEESGKDRLIVSLRPARQMQYESETGEPIFDENEQMLMTKVYTLAWYAAGKPMPFDEWAELLESIEYVNEETNDELPTPAED